VSGTDQQRLDILKGLPEPRNVLEVTVQENIGPTLRVVVVGRSADIHYGENEKISIDMAHNADAVFRIIFTAFGHVPGKTNYFPPWLSSLLDLYSSYVRIDESLELFSSICAPRGSPRSSADIRSDLPAFPPQIMVSYGTTAPGAQQRSYSHNYFPIGRFQPTMYTKFDIPDSDAVEVSQLRKEVSLNTGDSEFLKKLVELLEIKDCEMRLALVESGYNSETKELQAIYGSPMFTFTRSNDTVFGIDKLSYGEKRILAFLYHTHCSEHVVFADELVNGLHHKWIQKCLSSLKGKQSFLTSQNPLLMDYIAPTSEAEVMHSFVMCCPEVKDSERVLNLRNFSKDEASDFMKAYSFGIEKVSEILRNRNLW